MWSKKFSDSIFLSEAGAGVMPVIALGPSVPINRRFYTDRTVERMLTSNEIVISLRIGRPAAVLSQELQLNNSISNDATDPEGRRLLDDWPKRLQVTVNRQNVNIPRGQPRALDITRFVKFPTECQRNRCNSINLRWRIHKNRQNNEYFAAIYLMRKVTVENLVQRVPASRVLSLTDIWNTIWKRLGITNKAAAQTSIVISQFVQESSHNEVDEEDCVVVTPYISVSLLCPLLRSRIRLPVRTSACAHLQCFCLYNFLALNEVRPTWKCPVCKFPAPYENLFLDSLQQSILNDDRSLNCETVFFHADGTWSTEKTADQANEFCQTTHKLVTDVEDDEKIVINLISDVDEEDNDGSTAVTSNKSSKAFQPPPSKKLCKDHFVSSKSLPGMKHRGTLPSVHINAAFVKDSEGHRENVLGEPSDPNKELRQFVQQHFTYKECVYFKSKRDCSTVTPDTQCCCGELWKNHYHAVTEGAQSNSFDGPWQASEHIKTRGPSNAYGEIEFTGSSSTKGGRYLCKYVRISDEDSLDDTISLMLHYWDLGSPEPPSLCLSVIGGAKNFRLTGRRRDVFQQGLVKAAHTTGAWIITSGLNLGISAVVGQALAEGQSFHFDRNRRRRRIHCIGIAPWGYVRGKRHLLNKEISFKPKQYRVSTKIQSGKPVSLNQNHTHYIFVDDGHRRRYAGSKSAEFRALLEERLALPPDACSHPHYGTERCGLGIPVILLVVEGGHDVFIDCSNSIRQRVPVVVCDQTGRAADVLAFAVTNRDLFLTGDAHILKHLDRLLDKVYLAEGNSSRHHETSGEDAGLSRKKREAVSLIRNIVKDESLLSVFNMETGCAEDLDWALLCALIKKVDTVAATGDHLALSLAWNRIDIAATIFKLQKQINFEDIQSCTLKALADDRVEFVQLLLENGASLQRLVSMERLHWLYNSLDHVTSERFDRVMLYYLGISRSPTEPVLLANVRQLLRYMVGAYDNPIYCYDNGEDFIWEGFTTKTPPAQGSEEVTHAKLNVTFGEPFKELFLWAVLHCRQSMAEFLWSRSDDAVHLAIVATKIYHSMLATLPEYDTAECARLTQFKEQFEILALGVVEIGYVADQDNGGYLVEKEHEDWGSVPTLELAARANDQRFMSSVVCQDSLDLKWTNGLTAPFLYTLLCIFCPLALLSSDMIKLPPCSANENSRWLQKISRKVIRFYTAPKVKFYINMTSYFIFLLIFSYFLLFDMVSDKIAPLEIVLFIYIGALLLDELREILSTEAESQAAKLYEWWNFNAWNRLDLLLIIISTTAAMLRIGGQSTFTQARTVYVTSLVLVFVRVLRLYASSSDLGPKLVMMSGMMMELILFIPILLVPHLIYGVTTHSLMYTNRSFSGGALLDVVYLSYFQYFNVITTYLVDYETTSECLDPANANNTDIMSKCPKFHWMVPLLQAVYFLIQKLTLFTMLVAIFNNVFSEVQANSIRIWKFRMFFLVEEYGNKPFLPLPLCLVEDLLRFIHCGFHHCKRRIQVRSSMNESLVRGMSQEIVEFEREMVRKYLIQRTVENARSLDGLLTSMAPRIGELQEKADECQHSFRLGLGRDLREANGTLGNERMEQTQKKKHHKANEEWADLPSNESTLDSDANDKLQWEALEIRLKRVEEQIGQLSTEVTSALAPRNSHLVPGIKTVKTTTESSISVPQVEESSNEQLRRMEQRLRHLEASTERSLDCVENLLREILRSENSEPLPEFRDNRKVQHPPPASVGGVLKP